MLSLKLELGVGGRLRVRWRGVQEGGAGKGGEQEQMGRSDKQHEMHGSHRLLSVARDEARDGARDEAAIRAGSGPSAGSGSPLKNRSRERRRPDLYFI